MCAVWWRTVRPRGVDRHGARGRAHLCGVHGCGRAARIDPGASPTRRTPALHPRPPAITRPDDGGGSWGRSVGVGAALVVAAMARPLVVAPARRRASRRRRRAAGSPRQRGGRRAEAGALAVAQLCTGSVGGGEGAAARLRAAMRWPRSHARRGARDRRERERERDAAGARGGRGEDARSAVAP